ncbi:probable dolichyl pyrophosphate Man9GlcNAc2 alpha-1,3-glucosyltransferase [Drosophila guanche]|uniref:Alpha-1,3-glucosyltransferase n=1 Tax=Drosophila guanche TaxID=7266 RepID=A0A3B0K9G9_DROGU|nr:probable dolichyl pyrophosphate Man9GlcNAc2 alpha-1,3-glucosyltransferase [Drosophila guanche]SPP81671.1 blast:Probable dolichyl pyrophosphate Man9GlcNAc2 alpha-1%2C3-glucosyltransferase [Drosophila guanche]
MKSEILAIACVALSLRSIVSMYSFSGFDSPPMYGDYEAQRHWQEVTINLEPIQWYTNSSNNDLLYWGLDYPPLTAHHSYLMGRIAKIIDPRFVELHRSRGFQSRSHKTFMRLTVLLGDVSIYLPAILGVCVCIDKSFQCKSKLFSFMLLAAYPGQMLIDNGHFQYNNVSLGLAAAAIAAILHGKQYIAAFAFTLALNYKQMELYHSLPFFTYLLAECIAQNSFRLFAVKLAKIATIVLATFFLVWYPWSGSLQAVAEVLNRLFPLGRTVFEDKVSNFWCSLNIIWKLKQHVSNHHMALVCLGFTLISSLPTNITLFRKRCKMGFLLSLFNTAIAFFLFSFQVHEKTILLAALPTLCLLTWWPNEIILFLDVSVFTMLPLLERDGLLVPSLACVLIYHLICKCFCSETKPSSELKAFLNISKIFMIVIVGASLLIKAPSRYPDLWPLITSVIGCAYLVLFLVWGNFRHSTCTCRTVKIKSM